MSDIERIARESGSIEEFFSGLIATAEGIRPEDVTAEYIEEQRKKRVYPRARYQIGSRYGGYRLRGLRVYTQEELDALRAEVSEKLEEEVKV